MKIFHACLTHTGKVREHNEDRMGFDPAMGLFVVADGMGGHDHGEVAARIGVNAIVLGVAEGQNLSNAIESAHRAVCSHPLHVGGHTAMGATVVAVKVDESGHWECAWAGDSRAYWLEKTHVGSQLHQVSHDHTPVQALVDAGTITAQEARRHPDRNLIFQALGVTAPGRPTIVAEESSGVLEAGERLLLCSDGLNGVVDDATIHALLSASENLHLVAQSLVEAALDAGAPDNVTVIVLEAQ